MIFVIRKGYPAWGVGVIHSDVWHISPDKEVDTFWPRLDESRASQAKVLRSELIAASPEELEWAKGPLALQAIVFAALCGMRSKLRNEDLALS